MHARTSCYADGDLMCHGAQAVDGVRDREELFDDWLDERERADKEERKAEAKRRRGAFRDLLLSTK